MLGYNKQSPFPIVIVILLRDLIIVLMSQSFLSWGADGMIFWPGVRSYCHKEQRPSSGCGGVFSEGGLPRPVSEGSSGNPPPTQEPALVHSCLF